MDANKHILITGSQGFIGSYCARSYQGQYNVIGLDIKAASPADGICHYQADIRDAEVLDAIFRRYPISAVIHSAAEKSLAACEADFKRARSINYDASLRLAEMAFKHGAQFIFLSSDQVFDGERGNYDEKAETAPINAYGKLKVMVENVLKNEPKTAICRTALVFGPLPQTQRSLLLEVSRFSELKVQGFIVQHTCLRLGRDLPIHLPANEFINPTHVDLLARQLERVMAKDLSGILHCCGKDAVSRYDFGLRIAKKNGLSPAKISSAPGADPLRPRDVSMSTAWSEKRLELSFDSLDQMLDADNRMPD